MVIFFFIFFNSGLVEIEDAEAEDAVAVGGGGFVDVAAGEEEVIEDLLRV